MMLDGDPTRLDQVIRNVVGNAVKFTPPEGRVWVGLEWESRGKDQPPMGIVRVRDSGSGISPEVLPRVFDLFVQADQGIDRSNGGLGIGLTVVKRLVEMHGGSVRADSAGPGRGSEFTIRLPLSADPEAEARRSSTN